MINEIAVRALTWDENVDLLEWEEKMKKENINMTPLRIIMARYMYIFEKAYGSPVGFTPAEIMAIGNLTMNCTTKIRDSERKNSSSSGNGSKKEPLIVATAEDSKSKPKKEKVVKSANINIRK